jgi:hypothetical protein
MHDATAFNLTRAAYAVNEFSAITGLGRNAIYDAAKTGDLSLTKFGKSTRILAPDGAAFLNRHRRGRV